MSAPAPFDEGRWAAFLKARQRRALVIERGAGPQAADVAFREHFVGMDEEQTNYIAQRVVGALLRDLRERWAKQGGAR